MFLCDNPAGLVVLIVAFVVGSTRSLLLLQAFLDPVEGNREMCIGSYTECNRS
jgi:hypothetical protein